jgi:5'-nucleotidase
MRVGTTVVLLLALCLAASGTPLRILYTNDLHLRLERLESLAEQIGMERAAAPGGVLLLDAGDAWQDYRVPLYAVWGAEAMVEWMNRAGYDAMAIGNHELYWDSTRLRRLQGRATFTLLCADLVPLPGLEAPFVPAVVREVGGLRVLLIGAVTPEYLPYHDLPWLRFVDPAAAIRREVERFGARVDLIVALVHLSLAAAADVAARVPEVDVFVTGHSHEITPEPTRVGSAIHVQSGAFARRLGVLDLEVDEETAAVTVIDHRLVATEAKASPLPRRGFRHLMIFGIALAAVAAAILR